MGPYQIQVPDVSALTGMGYAVVSLNYRLGGSMRSAALDALRDGKAAIRFLRANAKALRIDPDRFAVWGNSAGGFMAAMLGVTGDQPTPFDDPDFGNASISSEVQAVIVWFGAEDRLPEPFRLAPYIQSSKALPPFLIANGDADSVISPQQAQRLHDELLRRGASSTLTIIRGAGHEDPLFMSTQMEPAFAFLEHYIGR
jgi:acetyl esterase/lipase